MSPRGATVLLAVCMGMLAAQAWGYCMPTEACWPTSADVAKLTAALDPSLTRDLVWDGPGYPYTCSVGIGAPYDQPVYAAGRNMPPVSVSTVIGTDDKCFENGYYPAFCSRAARNGPYFGWQPGFVVWPLNAQHVQSAVAWARTYNLSVCVAGTGHDFLNRHSCDNGMMIRTSLLANMTYVGDNALRVGSGVTFSQVFNKTATRSQFVASGWAPTVGVAGWSTGGGHGPFGPSAGLGVDNILEVELVVANGSIVTANMDGTTVVNPDGTTVKTDNNDMLWAIRGGGGSTWGVMTSFTLRTHNNPVGGFTVAVAVWYGELCGADLDAAKELVVNDLKWGMELGTKWSGLAWLTPSKNATQECGTWEYLTQWVYLGAETDEEFNQLWAAKIDGATKPIYDKVYTVQQWTEFEQHGTNVSFFPPISVYEPRPGDTVGGVPSVLVSRDQTAVNLAPLLEKVLMDCALHRSCHQQQLYQDITGNIGSTQQSFTSISSGFRSAVIHLVFGGNATIADEHYRLGPNSYFSESAYDLPGWQQRYWGDNYDRLIALKDMWDPTRVFGCHHCIGDTSE